MRRKPNVVVDAVQPEIEQTLASFGYELVQLKLGGRGGNQLLTVLLDKPGGVTSGDCAYMADRLSVLLDTLDPIRGRYTLMVSSPGLDRPLTKAADFERFVGERVSVRWSELGGKMESCEGTLKGVDDGEALLDTEGRELRVSLDDIEMANIVYDWRKHDAATE